MTQDPEPKSSSSPSLVELACRVRSDFIRQTKNTIPSSAQKVIIKAEEAARIYYNNDEKFFPSELEVLYEVLREFGIIAAHVPHDFHVHVANVIKYLEKSDKAVTKSHVTGLIFSRM